MGRHGTEVGLELLRLSEDPFRAKQTHAPDRVDGAVSDLELDVTAELRTDLFQQETVGLFDALQKPVSPILVACLREVALALHRHQDQHRRLGRPVVASLGPLHHHLGDVIDLQELVGRGPFR